MFRMLVEVTVYIIAKTDSTVGAGENKFLFYILVSAKIAGRILFKYRINKGFIKVH